MQTDYSKLILTEEELTVFEKFKKTDNAFLTVSEHRLLERKGLVQSVINGKSTWFEDPADGFCTLSQKGKELRSYRKQHNKELWLVNAKIPLIVSILTNIAITGIGLLLSQML